MTVARFTATAIIVNIMKVIITGGEGFIGKALTTALSKRAVALSTSEVKVLSIDRANGIEAGEYFSNANISDVDCVYHLAAQTSVFNENKTDMIRDNIELFKIVCDACRRYDIKLIYASSSTANPENTTSLYGISKQFAEQYARCYNPEATGVRFHNVYGPNPRQGTLLWYLLNNERVRLYNMGRNVRHFTYIDDIVEGLIYARLCGDRIVNVANPQITTTLELAQTVQRYKPLEIKLVGGTRRFDRTAQTVDDSIITVPLQYIQVEEGIKRVFDCV